MLSIAERYMVDQTIEPYNQILFTKFYKLLWKGQLIMAAWDVRNEDLVLLLIGVLEEDEWDELCEIIRNKEADVTETSMRIKSKKEAKIKANEFREKLIAAEKERAKAKKEAKIKPKDLTKKNK